MKLAYTPLVERQDEKSLDNLDIRRQKNEIREDTPGIRRVAVATPQPVKPFPVAYRRLLPRYGKDGRQKNFALS